MPYKQVVDTKKNFARTFLLIRRKFNLLVKTKKFIFMNYSGSNYKDAENYKDGIGVWTDTIDEQYIYISVPTWNQSQHSEAVAKSRNTRWESSQKICWV